MSANCANHVNGFTHLACDALDSEFDLGCKFEERESDKFSIDPRTGIQAWAEPFLVLYVSVGHPMLPDRPTLRYGLTRSQFAKGLSATDEDKERLLHAATPHIVANAQALRAGETPSAATDFLMLC